MIEVFDAPIMSQFCFDRNLTPACDMPFDISTEQAGCGF